MMSVAVQILLVVIRSALILYGSRYTAWVFVFLHAGVIAIYKKFAHASEAGCSLPGTLMMAGICHLLLSHEQLLTAAVSLVLGQLLLPAFLEEEALGPQLLGFAATAVPSIGLWIYSNTSTASSLPATFLGVFLLPVTGVMVQLLTWRASQAGWEGLQAVQGSWRKHGCAGMVAGAKSLVVPVTYLFLGGQLLLHTTNAVHPRARQDNTAGADTMSATSAVALIVCMLVGCGGDKTASEVMSKKLIRTQAILYELVPPKWADALVDSLPEEAVLAATAAAAAAAAKAMGRANGRPPVARQASVDACIQDCASDWQSDLAVAPSSRSASSRLQGANSNVEGAWACALASARSTVQSNTSTRSLEHYLRSPCTHTSGPKVVNLRQAVGGGAAEEEALEMEMEMEDTYDASVAVGAARISRKSSSHDNRAGGGAGAFEGKGGDETLPSSTGSDQIRRIPSSSLPNYNTAMSNGSPAAQALARAAAQALTSGGSDGPGSAEPRSMDKLSHLGANSNSGLCSLDESGQGLNADCVLPTRPAFELPSPRRTGGGSGRSGSAGTSMEQPIRTDSSPPLPILRKVATSKTLDSGRYGHTPPSPPPPTLHRQYSEVGPRRMSHDQPAGQVSISPSSSLLSRSSYQGFFGRFSGVGQQPAAGAAQHPLVLGPRTPSGRLLAGTAAEAAAVLPRGVLAEYRSDVGVMFTDIVGFTTAAAISEATEVVALLQEVFSSFDALLEQPKYLGRIEKVDLIGDAAMFMAEGPRYASLLLDLGLNLHEATAKIQMPGTGGPVRLRTGLSCGGVVCGVVGHKRRKFSAWGHTVNLASRMESTGEPGGIQMTKEMAQEIEAQGGPPPGFVIQHRKGVYVKGILNEVMTTYVARPISEAVSEGDSSDSDS